MTAFDRAVREYARDASRLSREATTSELTYYPAIRSLLAATLRHLALPDDVRTSTTERRPGGGTDLPDLALYDGAGDFVLVAGEVKTPAEDLQEMANSTDRNDQVGRYLALSRAVVLSNVRGFGLVTVEPGYTPRGPVPPRHRRLEQTVELWPSRTALREGQPVAPEAAKALADLIEAAVTRYAPIGEPATLARVLARQARRAKAALPARFGEAIKGLADDFGAALGITFEGEGGEEFFRSSLIQTVFYGLFAGWLLHSRSWANAPFRWRDLPQYLRIPFLGELFHEIQHPRRIAELGLGQYLDWASETLERVNRSTFFARLTLPTLSRAEDVLDRDVATAIVYFYEPFLETFDPELRKQLGVWYTPPEIVRYQVRKIEGLLRAELGCPLGFADERVVVLDPCCGTGAYLIEVLHCIADTLRGEGMEAELGDTLLQALCDRVLGFEILTAPFVISHLQLYLALASLGVEPARARRPGVYLTNALTGWHERGQTHLNFPELQEERDAAQRVKMEARIIVVLGNPPYNRFAGAPMAEESDLVDPYKGIRRNDEGRQVGQSRLFEQWGIRKHLLDDLYIRFFRLAEERIGQAADYGVVSFISNSSYLAGRSHPIMRESLLSSFDDIWIDNLHGNRLASERTPSGESCETVFNMESGSPGIKVGTCISTFVKKNGPHPRPVDCRVHVRDFWGRAADKRRALLESLEMLDWSPTQLAEAEREPAGPRRYETFTSTAERRWKLVPYETVGGFDEWLALDELFPAAYQGVNPNRGLEGSVVDHDREALESRIRDLWSPLSDTELAARHPILFQSRAGYDGPSVRRYLVESGGFRSDLIVPYMVFPFDLRWLYYERDGGLLNRPRPELGQNLSANQFLVAVPQPRRVSESRPLFATCLFDLHLHDRGSVGFPAELRATTSDSPDLFEAPADRPPSANIEARAWQAMSQHWGIAGDLHSAAARGFARKLIRVCLALGHSPQYQADHAENLAQDWAHLPIPRDRELFENLAETGELLTILLDPTAHAREVVRGVLGPRAAALAVLARNAGGTVRETDLCISVSYFGGARGDWRERSPDPAEPTDRFWGETTGNLYLNTDIFFRNVPVAVWRYELGGYPVLKKWLGYRAASRRGGHPLSLAEKDHFREIVQRVAAILSLSERLDQLYARAASDAWTADEAGPR